MNKIAEYSNGTYLVKLYNDGTKVRSGDVFTPDYPESIDVKITNKCDINCPWCHERSHINGAHADTEYLLSKLSGLPAGVEIAIGGGNPLEHPDIDYILDIFSKRGYISNMTVNGNHIDRYLSKIERLINDRLIYGLGISWSKDKLLDTPNTVYHMIAGVHTFNDISSLLLSGRKVLLLGYKQFGRGSEYYHRGTLRNIRYIRDNLWKILGKGCLSFDNLAINQLNVLSHLTEQGIKEMYMGDDGQYTMYFDAVEGNYAISSTAERCKAVSTASEFFNLVKGDI